MIKEEENRFKESSDNAYELFVDLFNAFKDSKVVTEGENTRHFAFDIMVGISMFTSAIMKSLGRASNSGDKIFNFYVKQLLPDSYMKSEDLFSSAFACKIPFEEQTAS